MPYNTTPIEPSKEVTGTVSLPLARVKKIIHADKDTSNCSNNAAFVVALATEMFLQHLADQSYNMVKAERKPRRNVQYKDVANAISRIDNLEFLTDVVPRTLTYKQFKQAKAKADAGMEEQNGALPNGQTRLDGQGRLDSNAMQVDGPSEQPSKDGASSLPEEQPITPASVQIMNPAPPDDMEMDFTTPPSRPISQHRPPSSSIGYQMD